METEAEVVNAKWIEAEAEVEAVNKLLDAEVIKIYRLHCFHYSGIGGKIFLFLGIFLEIEPNLKLCWTTAKLKGNRPYYYLHQQNWNTVFKIKEM